MDIGPDGAAFYKEIAGNKVWSEEAYIILGGRGPCRYLVGNSLSRRVARVWVAVGQATCVPASVTAQMQPGRLPFSEIHPLTNG